ncbi:MAG: DUF2878 domain-containing protein [Desulfofustis sp.]|jgi:hypothetical protein
MSLVINVLTYQIVWFLCVFMGNVGAFLSLLLLALHLFRSRFLREDLIMMFVLLLIGMVVDGAIRYGGFISFTVDGFPIPFWLAVIWLALAILPHHSLYWLKGRPLLSVLFAAVGGPLAYWAGVRFGSAEFNSPLLVSLALLAVVWAVLWPLAMAVANYILPRDRIDTVPSQTDSA